MDEQKQKGIIWLASYPKSGNTWLRIFLYNLINQMQNPGTSPVDINQMDTICVSINAKDYYETVLSKEWDKITDQEITSSREAVQQHVLERESGVVFAKTHNAFVKENGHPTINLSATLGAIYVVRNPLDVAVSFAHYSSADFDNIIYLMSINGHTITKDQIQGGEYWGSWSEHVQSWTKSRHPKLLVLRYEDMLSTPEVTFGHVAKFLGLAPDLATLQTAIKHSSLNELKKQEKLHSFREKPDTAEMFFREGKSDQWRNNLSEAQIEELTKHHKSMMKRFGYLPKSNGS